MRTVEFRLYPTQAQEQQIEQWLAFNRKLWNSALALLKELEDFSAYDKASKTRVPCCPVPWSYRWMKGDDGSWLPIPYSEIRRHKRAHLSCPMPQPYREPRLTGDNYQSLCKVYAKKNHPDWADLQACPTAIARGTLQALATAWAEYRKGKRKPPRFKPLSKPLVTLSDCDCKKGARVNGDTVTLPSLRAMRIKGNRDGRRWPTDLEVCTYRITKEPSGWYLLLVGKVHVPKLRETALAVGLDAGVVHDLTTSAGKFIDGPNPLDAALRRLERLQQKLARQQEGGANWRKTQARIARLHERIRRTRKLFAHKTTTYLLRTYGTLVIEDLKLQNMVRRPKPKLAEDGQSYLPNQAAAKAGLNRRLLDKGLGQLLTMLETKAAEHDRAVIRTNPAYSSQKCSCCGHTAAENRPAQDRFECTACGLTLNADVNAARNLLADVTG